MSDQKWPEQMERIRRYWNRLEALCDGIVFDRPAASLIDDVHAFFVECHSMKDWLKNDDTFTKYSNKEIEDFVTATPVLAICADFANGKKHLVCDAKRSGSEEFRSGSKPTPIYYLEIVRPPDIAGDEENIVSPEDRASKHEVNADQADAIRNKWLEIGVPPEDIEIRLVVDIEHDGGTLNLDRGVADFAFDAVEAWDAFIQTQS